MEQIRYSHHARIRMAERGITEAEIAAVIVDPEIRYTDLKGNPVLIRTIGGRRIKVVVARDSNPPRVITTGD